MPTLRQRPQKLVRKKKQSFNIYKPQVQCVLFSTWGVVRTELYFQLPGLTKASRAMQNQRKTKGKLNYANKHRKRDLEL